MLVETFFARTKMNTSQLLDIFRHDVFPRDKLAKLEKPRHPLALTVKSDKHDKSWQHWLALFVNPNGKVFFPDTLPKSCLFLALRLIDSSATTTLAAMESIRKTEFKLSIPNLICVDCFAPFFCNVVVAVCR